MHHASTNNSGTADLERGSSSSSSAPSSSILKKKRSGTTGINNTINTAHSQKWSYFNWSYWRSYLSYNKLQQVWNNLTYIDLVKFIVGVSLLMLITGIAMELHYHTYVWQSTSLAEMLKPVHRTKCVLDGVDLNDDKSYRSHEQSKVTPVSSALRNPQLKIGILMVYDNRGGDWEPELMKKVIANRKLYCSLHGYDLIDGSNEIVLSRPTAWTKISATLSHIHKYDYIFYIDMDVVIMDLNRPVNVYLQGMSIGVEDKRINNDNIIVESNTKASGGKGGSSGTSSGTSNNNDNNKNSNYADFVMTGDWNGPNTGVWFARNSTWMYWFLTTAWKQSQLIPKKSPEGVSYPFEYEQRAFHFMLNTNAWKDRGLAAYEGKGSEDIASHFKFLPQCALNSYSLHPFYWKGEREVSQYVPGDFLVHFAGKKGKAKTNLLEYYLMESKKEQMKIPI